MPESYVQTVTVISAMLGLLVMGEKITREKYKYRVRVCLALSIAAAAVVLVAPFIGKIFPSAVGFLVHVIFQGLVFGAIFWFIGIVVVAYAAWVGD